MVFEVCCWRLLLFVTPLYGLLASSIVEGREEGVIVMLMLSAFGCFMRLYSLYRMI
ncbi:hypothetical protein F5H01DRAFT_339888 [Linnemannia elongata]|nr:hypothetical protein F5H01DRAFT_339888 [Linnemannia elongata]